MSTSTLARMQTVKTGFVEDNLSKMARRLAQSIGYIGLAEAQARKPTETDRYREKVLCFLKEKGWMPYEHRSVFQYQQDQILAMKASEKPHDAVMSIPQMYIQRELQRAKENIPSRQSQDEWERVRALSLRQFFTGITMKAKQARTSENLEALSFGELKTIISALNGILGRDDVRATRLQMTDYAVSVDDAGMMFPWQWIEVPLVLYGLPIPLPVLEYVEQIGKTFPKAEFIIEHLTNRDPRKLLSQPLVTTLLEATETLATVRGGEARARREKIRFVGERIRKGRLTLDEINFEEHGVTQQEVHWYLYDPFLKMRLHYDEEGKYEDLYLFVWEEPDFQATVLD